MMHHHHGHEDHHEYHQHTGMHRIEHIVRDHLDLPEQIIASPVCTCGGQVRWMCGKPPSPRKNPGWG